MNKVEKEEMKKIAMNDAYRLEEIADEIKALLDEATIIVEKYSENGVFARAQSYWIPNIRINLDGNHDWCGKAGHTIEETIDEIRRYYRDYDDEEIDD